ncbi:hypothetical protein GF338_05780 [candidate division WOR-3 bacterium]|nr:hypothetical protein [candidate division WOR-3 bacterium]
MNFKKTLILCIILGGIVPSLKADYYQPDLFPIGLTGINPSGYSCPYADANVTPPWAWTPDLSSNNEQKLIFDLGINCIGATDAVPRYLLDFNPEEDHDANNYLYKVCKPLTDEDNPVYLITVNYYVPDTLKAFMCCTGTMLNPYKEDDTLMVDSSLCCEYSFDTIKNKGSFSTAPSTFFRSPHRPTQSWGWGSMLFTTRGDCEGKVGWQTIEYTIENGDTVNMKGVAPWGCHGGEESNWNTYEGDTLWRNMADSFVDSCFDNFFTNHSDMAEYIWGYTLMAEGPATTRGKEKYGNSTPGCWAAVNRIFRGGNPTYRNKFNVDDTIAAAEHNGVRGVEETNSTFTSGDFSGHRMIFCKSEIRCLFDTGYNIFEYLPDIDALYYHPHSMVLAQWNYGDQAVFESWLYRKNNRKILNQSEVGSWKGNMVGTQGFGEHFAAIYFQKYGKTPGGPTGQKRRWISTLCLEWQEVPSTGDAAEARRPCPPEIRCLVYLSLSRGVKGILFHPWSLSTNNEVYPDVQIPYTGSIPKDEYWIGLRDHEGYPFGFKTDTYHKLNNGNSGSYQHTYWHDNYHDYTYYYLDTLIQEIKLITDILIDLDWVNAYSLMSTDPNWTNPCPHYYMEDVWGVNYMDVAFFDHPYEPVGVEFFMMVNREGIADMTNRNVGVALDANHWPESDTLILTDMAQRDNPRKLIREGDRYTFTEEFEPGEGKLYRAAPNNLAPVANLTSKGGKK